MIDKKTELLQKITRKDIRLMWSNALGTILSVSDDLIYVIGFSTPKMSEMVSVTLPDDIFINGIINSVDINGIVGVTVLGSTKNISVGDLVITLDTLPFINVGFAVLGRVLNVLGEPIDGAGSIKGKLTKMIIEQEAPSIIERQPVNESLETGVKFVDSMVPIGCGQRELIIGDPKTGKTAVTIDSMLHQVDKEVICIYVAIGQRQKSVLNIKKVLNKFFTLSKTVLISATASDPAAMQFLAPFAGCAVGEYFMNKGHKSLVIYDDLSKHAVAYRQMSLLLRRPPGREGYPGDVFYLHSRLLERAAKLKNEIFDNYIYIGGSLTALPIIETVDGDVSAYIPTNVISITDGQIYLESELFHQGIRPAISPGVSVSRVGSAAQNRIIKKMAEPLKLDLAQYSELYEFMQLGMPLDIKSIFILEKGARLQKLMMQTTKKPVKMSIQIILLFGGINEMLNDIKVDWLNIYERKLASIVYIEMFYKLLVIVLPLQLLNKFVPFLINIIKAYTVELNYE
jgi:F-type H+-transporting ATPase subunit alpha